MAEWRNGGIAEWRNGGMVEWQNGGIGQRIDLGGMAEWAMYQNYLKHLQYTLMTLTPTPFNLL